MPDIEALISRWATQDFDLGPTDYESLADNQPQLTAIAYFGLVSDQTLRPVDSAGRMALGLPNNSSGRACIIQPGNGSSRLDLTKYDNLAQSKPLDNADLGLVRIGRNRDLHRSRWHTH